MSSHMAVNACLVPLCSMDGLAVTTTEGIGSIQDGLHPCQVMYQPIVHTCMNLQQQVLINIYLAFSLLQFW